MSDIQIYGNPQIMEALGQGYPHHFQYIECMAIAPSDVNTIYTYNGSSLNMTHDGGKNWKSKSVLLIR